jgi:type IV pilus assembly protein PilB
MARKRLGELLVEAGLLTDEQVSGVLAEQKHRRGRLGEVIVAAGLATEPEIASALSRQMGIPCVDLQQTPIEPAAIALIPEKIARKHLIVPIQIEDRELHMAMADPMSFEAFEDVRFASGYTVRPFIATRTDVLWAIDQHYHLGSSFSTIVKDIEYDRTVEVVTDRTAPQDPSELEDLVRKSEAAPVIRMVNLMIAQAIDQGASDIHVEPKKTKFAVRHRVDGLLRTSLDLPKWVQAAVVSRIKIMAGMDIAEKRLPQDGRITVRVGARPLDLRVSTIPTLYGEKVVLRILDSATASIPIDSLGFPPRELAAVLDMVRRPQGILLVTGPTGSGKTTTLYSMLNRVKGTDKNVSTIEDPIEYELDGVNQVAVNDRIGNTFPAMLRSMLRQDPDVLLVGEMRDLETATVAIQASLTGHLVLSTIHTTGAVATVTRLRNLGIPPYLLASTILGVLAQRLVRLVCTKCRVAVEPPPELLSRYRRHFPEGSVFYGGKGCLACGGTGYKGRTGVYELLEFDPRVREMVTVNAPEGEILQAAIARGMATLQQAALDKVRAGLTTLEEVYRVVDTADDLTGNCPGCGHPVATDFAVCPRCAHPVASACPGCLRPVSPDWKHCPYCRLRLATADDRDGAAPKSPLDA